MSISSVGEDVGVLENRDEVVGIGGGGGRVAVVSKGWLGLGVSGEGMGSVGTRRGLLELLVGRIMGCESGTMGVSGIETLGGREIV